jgi:lysophospholipase L1-like esterase
LAQQLACGAVAVNAAAGGATVFNATNDYTNALKTIVCQLNAANNVLGGAAVGIDVTNIPAATQTLACLTGAIAGTSAPFGSYDMYSQWNAIACNLNTIASNTGETSPGGLQGGSIYALMQAAICSMNQIAANGFTPAELFHFVVGDRPAGSIFSRAGAAYELADSAPPTSSPRWYTVTSAQGIIFAVGDSITLGATATESYFPKVQRAQASDLRLHNSNLAVNAAYLSNSGSAATNMTDITTTYVDPVFTGQKGVAVVFGGSNDMFLGGVTGAVAFARLQTVCGLIRSSHPNVKIVAVTPLPRQNNAPFETARQAMRTLINGGDSSYDFVADWGGNATMASNAAASTNATYYTDQIHPTNAGQIIGASVVGPAVALALTAAGL